MSAKRVSAGVRQAKRRKATSVNSAEIMELVRAGVNRFILKDAPIGDFRRAIRAAARKGELASHPLTGAVFRRLVKQAIKERKRRVSRSSRPKINQ